MMVSDPPLCDGVDPPGAAEKPLRLLQRLGIQPARQGAAGALLDRVVGAGQAGERIHDQHDVIAHLDPAASPLQRQLRHGDVALGRIVEAGGNHLAHPGGLHLEDFLRAARPPAG